MRSESGIEPGGGPGKLQSVRGRGPIATFAAAAALCAGGAPAASAGTVGDLDIDYTATTTNWTEFPGRASQATYQPCSGAASLAGSGAWIGESVLSDPWESQFKLGKAYNVSIHPFELAPGAPTPDSTRQVAETLFKQSHSLSLGESTVCAQSLAGLTYPTAKAKAPARSRKTAEVKCGGGGSVISGGGKVAGQFRGPRLVKSLPFDSGDANAVPDDGWRIVVDNPSKKGRTITAYAICTTTTGFTYISEQTNAPKRTRYHRQVGCPGGEYAIGGGVTHNIGFGDARLVASRHVPFPQYDGWIAEVDNLSQTKRKATTFTICHT